MTTSLKDLLEQRDALDRQIKETKSREKADAVAKIKALMAEFGVTLADISERENARARQHKGSKVAPKYRNKESGETWSGRGLQPKWLKAALTGGASLADFAI